MLKWNVDLLIIGGSITGITAAYEASKNGYRVLLVTSDTFLGYELTKWQRPWIRWKQNEKQLLEQWFPMDKNMKHLNDEELIPLHMDRLKKKFEDRLLDVDVELLYGSYVIESNKKEHSWEVIIGNKAGKQKVHTKWIIDTTEVQQIPQPNIEQIVHRTIELTQVQPKYKSSYQVPAELEINEGKVFIYPGAFSPDHIFIDLPIRISPTSKDSLQYQTEVEYLARETTLKVVKYLVHHEEDFSNAKIGLGSLEVMKAADMNPVEKLKIGRKVIEDIRNRKHSWKVPINIYISEKADKKESLSCTAYEVDVVVAGGGTSGATAARVASQEGVKTLLTEMNSALGGTGTIGGVNRYWFGNRSGYTQEIDQKVGELATALKQSHDFKIWSEYDEWNAEIKAFVLLDLCLKSGVEVLFHSIVMNTIMDGQVVKGVELATPFGKVVVNGKVIIDATGDGDVSVQAGAKYIYGNERDRLPLWYSLAQYNEPGKTKNNFTSSVDVGDIKDYTRCILEGRRRGENMYDHGTYLAPRETRHIIGDTIITLKDQMLLRHFKDTINICFSNHDPKGRSTADMIYFGILPPNLEIEIPYKTVLPKGIEGLLVAGKAISATHDAFPAIRMQSDLQNLGGAVGVAAAIAAGKNIFPRMVDVKELQQKLKDHEVLPAQYFMENDQSEVLDWKELISNIQEDEPFEWLEMDMTRSINQISPMVLILFAESEQILPLLKEAYEVSKGERKLIFARLLLWHGDEQGLEDIIHKIKKDWEEESPLPRRKGSTRFAVMPPDHGVMPETVYLLYSLARSTSRLCLPIYEELVSRLDKSKRDYRDLEAGIFHYVDCVAYGAEHLGFPEFIPLLKQLLELKEFQDQIRVQGLEPDILGERLAYLRMVISRALARCGDKQGLILLCEFLKDKRKVLVQSAIDELKQLTGFNLNLDYVQWKDAILDQEFDWNPKPWEQELY